MKVHNCLLCQSSRLVKVVDLGFHPLADTFLKKEDLSLPEATYPLFILLCEACGHVMNGYIVSAQERYQAHDYSYDSANSKAAIHHFHEMAQAVCTSQRVQEKDLVVDIGSNVGTLLSHFKAEAGTEVFGVEPSHNIAALAIKNDIPTHEGFFDEGAVEQILNRGRAKVVTATNVFNHIEEVPALIRRVQTVLDRDGVFVVETPYLLDLIEKTAFDTMYLEHMSYFSIKPLREFLKSVGMVISDISVNEYMGGSVRISMRQNAAESPEVESFVKRELQASLFSPEPYRLFTKRIEKFKSALCSELYQIKLSGGNIIGIGAATKGNTLLNYCKIDGSLLNFVTDSSPLKIGKYTPGSHIPIRADEDIDESVTHGLILPWNIGSLLKEKLKHLNLNFLVPQMEIH